MTTITPQELAGNPLAFLERVEAGERIVVVRDQRPVAEIQPIATPTPRTGLRPYGLAAGQFRLPDDFNAPLPEDLLREFEGT